MQRQQHDSSHSNAGEDAGHSDVSKLETILAVNAGMTLLQEPAAQDSHGHQRDGRDEATQWEGYREVACRGAECGRVNSVQAHTVQR